MNDLKLLDGAGLAVTPRLRKIGDGLLRECKDTVATLTKNLSAELSALSKQQAKALADAIFVGMTAVEALEYDNRHARILEFCEEMGWCLG